MTLTKKILCFVLIFLIAFATYGCANKSTSSGSHTSANTSTHAFKMAGNAVKNLFIKSDWDHLTNAKIKKTTTQQQIDYATKLVSKIKPKEKGDANTVFGLGFILAIENAQKQLDEKNGTVSTDNNSPLPTYVQAVENRMYVLDERLFAAITSFTIHTDQKDNRDSQKAAESHSINELVEVEDAAILIYQPHPRFGTGIKGSVPKKLKSFNQKFTAFGKKVNNDANELKEAVKKKDQKAEEKGIRSLKSDQEKSDELEKRYGFTPKKYDPIKDAGKNPSAGIQHQKKPPKYVPKKNDVVLKGHTLKNKDRLEHFIKIAGKNNNSKIRVVKYIVPQGVIIYDLQSRYDKNANQGWIDVKPNLHYYSKLKDDTQDVFNNAPQQCGSIMKDKEHGYYVLQKCRTNWEYQLLPIPNDHDKG